jgi:hypothetical protein
MDPNTPYPSDTTTTLDEPQQERTARWASTRLRRTAHRMDEDQTGRDLLLMAADRVDAIERRLPELLSRQGVEELENQVREHPLTMMAIAVGAGFALERTRLLQTVGGAVATGHAGGAAAAGLAQ